MGCAGVRSILRSLINLFYPLIHVRTFKPFSDLPPNSSQASFFLINHKQKRLNFTTPWRCLRADLFSALPQSLRKPLRSFLESLRAIRTNLRPGSTKSRTRFRRSIDALFFQRTFTRKYCLCFSTLFFFGPSPRTDPPRFRDPPSCSVSLGTLHLLPPPPPGSSSLERRSRVDSSLFGVFYRSSRRS